MSQKASANDAKEIWEFQGTLLRGKESAQFIFFLLQFLCSCRFIVSDLIGQHVSNVEDNTYTEKNAINKKLAIMLKWISQPETGSVNAAVLGINFVYKPNIPTPNLV